MFAKTKGENVDTERYLIGAIGGPNFGDEAILKIWTLYYRTQFEGRLICDGFRNPCLTFDLGSDVLSAPLHLSIWQALTDLKTIYSNKGSITFEDIDLVLKPFEETNIESIHFVGGGYINALWPINYALLGLARFAGWKLKVPVIATGQGLLPALQTEHDELRTLFGSLEKIDTREQYSEEVSGSPTCTGDDAILYFAGDESVYSFHYSQPFIGLSLQNHLFSGLSVIGGFFTDEALTAMKKAGFGKILIFEAAPEDIHQLDRSFLEKAYRYGIYVEFVSTFSMLEKGLPYHPDSFVFTSRYHVHFFYSMMGIGGVALYENDYYKIKHAGITAMGSLWPVMKADNLNIPQAIKEISKGSIAVIPEKKSAFIERKKGLCTNMENIRAKPPENQETILKIMNYVLGL